MNVIKIENLWKEYRLGLISYGTMVNDLQSWWARVRGKEDPNSLITASKEHEKQIEGNRFWALRGVDLEIRKGEIIGIIGKNGAGKSTLLKILSRVTSPTRGNIKIKGRIASLLEVGTGFHPELTGRENVFLNGAILGMTKQEIRLKLDEIVDFSGVEQYLDTPVKRYSSGMRVRLAFAVAAHLEPEILVIDEVLAVGDMGFQKKCLGKMQRISEEGRTIIIVSHNMASIKRLCSKVALMKDGVISDLAAPESIINDYLSDNQLSQSRVVFPRVDEAPAQLHEAAITVPGMGETTNVPSDRPFTVTIKYSIKEQLSYAQAAVAVISGNTMEPVFVTTSADMNDDEMTSMRPGSYLSTVNIPANFLNTGQYFLNLRIWGALPNQKRKSQAAALNALTFQIEETRTIVSGFADNRGGYVTPVFKWDISPSN